MQNYIWGLFGGKNKEESGEFTEAHMGEENAFYYNKELARWVVRGEEDKVAEANNATLQPPKLPDSVATPRSNIGDHHGARMPLTSADLYTKIPGIEVMESKKTKGTDSILPTAAKSQFIPENTGDSNDYDFVN